MHKVRIEMEISAAHNLSLPYDSPCNGLHGHNWKVTIDVASPALNNDGMIIDFTHVKKATHGVIDHKYLNDILDFNTTAENMTLWVRDQVDSAIKKHCVEIAGVAYCSRVEIFETAKNCAVWEKQ